MRNNGCIETELKRSMRGARPKEYTVHGQSTVKHAPEICCSTITQNLTGASTYNNNANGRDWQSNGKLSGEGSDFGGTKQLEP